MFLYRPISVDLHKHSVLFEIVDRHWFALVQDVVLILSVKSYEFTIELDIKVLLYGIEEHDRVSGWHLDYVLNQVFALEIIDFVLLEF